MTIPFIGAFLVSSISYPLAKQLANAWDVIDRPNSRKIHTSPTPRTGGVMIFVAFLLLSLFFMHYIAWWHVLSLILLFSVGFWDDVSYVKPSIRLFLQVIISVFFVIAGQIYLTDYVIVTMPFAIAVPFAIFCIVGVTNAYNIVDGLNGLSSGCAFIFFVLTACLAYIYNDHFLLVYSLLFAGGLLGFIVFNFPFGKIFLGDGGSYLIGFSVATIAFMAVKRHPEVSPWTFLFITIIPVFDTLFAIFRRRKLKRSAFKADKRHLHHIFKRRYKSEIKAVVVIWSLQLLFGTIALIFHNNTFMLLLLIILSTLLLRRLWFKRINFIGIKI